MRLARQIIFVSTMITAIQGKDKANGYITAVSVGIASAAIFIKEPS